MNYDDKEMVYIPSEYLSGWPKLFLEGVRRARAMGIMPLDKFVTETRV